MFGRPKTERCERCGKAPVAFRYHFAKGTAVACLNCHVTTPELHRLDWERITR